MLPPLSADDEKLLLAFADPQHETAVARSAPRLEALLANAEFHGVLPIMLRKLSTQGEAALPADSRLGARLAELRHGQMMATGQSMLLQYHGERVMRSLAESGIPARVVKGPVFARRLYRHPSDRPFTDIDILVTPEHLPRTVPIMEAAGFRLASDMADSLKLQEFKWLARDNESLMVELQGNLVHDTGMRRRLSLGFEELGRIDGDDRDTPAALLAIAIVHAAGGHKFHRLQLCVDVLQGVRSLGGPADEERLLWAARLAGIELELATVLDVTGRLFGEERALAISARIQGGVGLMIARRLITPRTLLDVASSEKTGSRLRRDMFRWVQRLTRPADANG